MQATIERHAGIAVSGFIVGGGYTGKTEELDATVRRASEMMLAEFNRPIEIRFNSDRHSGGAWLKNSLPGFSGNCQLGLCAGLAKIRPEGLTDNEWWDMPRAEREVLPEEIKIDVVADGSCLKHRADRNCLRASGTDYAFNYFASLEDGLEWIRLHVDYRKLTA